MCLLASFSGDFHYNYLKKSPAMIIDFAPALQARKFLRVYSQEEYTLRVGGSRWMRNMWRALFSGKFENIQVLRYL